MAIASEGLGLTDGLTLIMFSGKMFEYPAFNDLSWFWVFSPAIIGIGIVLFVTVVKTLR